MSVFRIDRFELPARAVDLTATFLARVEETHALLRGCEGYRTDRILVERGGTGILTLVEWRDDAAIAAARARVDAARTGSGFDPQTFLRETGISAVFATYVLAPTGPLAAG